MLSLGAVRTTPKILALVILLNIAMAVVGLIGVFALKTVSDDAVLAANAAQRSVASARINQNVLALNRLELLIAADPRPERIRELTADAGREMEQARQRFDTIRTSPAPVVQQALRKAETAFEPLRASVQRTLATAAQIQGTVTADQQKQLDELSLNSRNIMVDTRQAVTEMTNVLIGRSDGRAKAIQETADSKEKLLYIIMAITGLVGIGLGVLIGQFGIARPIRAINETLASLADGKFDTKVTGTERKDEVGDIARAAEIFKANGNETNRLRAEQEASKAQQE